MPKPTSELTGPTRSTIGEIDSAGACLEASGESMFDFRIVDFQVCTSMAGMRCWQANWLPARRHLHRIVADCLVSLKARRDFQYHAALGVASGIAVRDVRS